MEEVADKSIATPRLAFVLVGLFAGLAIVLAMIGTYGVISYPLPNGALNLIADGPGRTAAGSPAPRLSQAAVLVLTGTTLGIALTLMLSRLLQNMIYQVSPLRPTHLRFRRSPGRSRRHARLLSSCEAGNKSKPYDCIAGRVTLHYSLPDSLKDNWATRPARRPLL